MTNTIGSYSISAIRKLLNAAFDDVGLIALCQDRFPELCDNLARGLRKDEILIVILDHFRRWEDFSPLLAAVQTERPELYNRFEPHLLISAHENESNFQPLFLHEASLAYTFDLDELINDCLDCLLENRGLIGFCVSCNAPLFLSNFCERLKHEWGRSRVRLKPSLVLNPIHTSIDRAIITIERRYLPALKESDVLFSVQAMGESTAARFWQDLCEKLQDQVLANRLIVVLAVSPEDTAPAGTIRLRQPQFRKAHVLCWVRRVVQGLAWPEALIELWTDTLIAECTHDEALEVEWVYDHIENMLDLLQRERKSSHFQIEIERRRRIYVPTSY